MRAALLVLALALPLAAGAEPTAPAPQLAITERAYDAGKIDQGTKIEHTFLLRNTGTAPLTVDAKPG